MLKVAVLQLTSSSHNSVSLVSYGSYKADFCAKKNDSSVMSNKNVKIDSSCHRQLFLPVFQICVLRIPVHLRDKLQTSSEPTSDSSDCEENESPTHSKGTTPVAARTRSKLKTQAASEVIVSGCYSSIVAVLQQSCCKAVSLMLNFIMENHIIVIFLQDNSRCVP